MEYSKVVFINVYNFISLSGVELCIDGRDFLYEVMEHDTRLYNKWAFVNGKHDTRYVLKNVRLPMNEFNYKEVLDRFFRLLVLQ